MELDLGAARSWQLPAYHVTLRRALVVVPLAALLALASFAMAALTASSLEAAPASGATRALVTCPDRPITGQRVYDCAGLLTPGEIADLETRALAVQRAGAPVVVYLQAKDTSYDQTLSDAASLMARWDVESKPGAKDGLVIMLNLKPSDLRHGQVALYAGQTLLNGPLPQSELERIYQDVMLPKLASGETAAGIAAGLDTAASDLRAGGPPPPPWQGPARAIGTIPYNILAVLLALAALGTGLYSARRAREAAPQLTTMPTSSPPAQLPPAVAGALISGKVGAQQMEATILDFARRGLLRIEPAERNRASIQLLGDGEGLTGYERSLWNALWEQAAPDMAIPRERMYQVAAHWRPATSELRGDLVMRGWLDGEVWTKRLPLLALTIVGFALAVAGVVLGILAAEVWPFIGALICAVAGAIALVFMLRIPAVTAEGQRAAQPARNYLAGLNVPQSGVDLNEALPYLVAAGLGGAYGSRLRMEAERADGSYVALYPYWIMMHHSMAPPASSGGGVSGATGAAAGGGGAGGSF
ncbi:MAG TPA: TPM domain-containing protein [Ktedonobacterales bacterium]|nr:TPM domain-containing protein [Ktedonobacterales bacterium]